MNYPGDIGWALIVWKLSKMEFNKNNYDICIVIVLHISNGYGSPLLCLAD